LNETHEGTIAFSAYDTIMEKIQWCDVVAIGPGISRDEETQQLLQKIISSCTKPTVIDADGLLAWNKQRAIMKETNCILTPHSGELATMLEISDKEIECNRIAVVQKAAKELNAIILLKGNPTIIATQDGKIFFNPTGNAGMATAGSGDVLTGIIAGLLAQMIHSENTVLQTSLLNATLCGAYLHGLAGDIAKEKLGIHSLMAMDIVEFLPQAILSVQ
jgi:NAD(P)H-hydrate epimerase